MRVGDQRRRAEILEPIRDRLDAEQHRQRQCDGAELVDRDMAGSDRRPLRQQDGDAVAALDTAAGERIGEPVRGCPQGTIADLFDDAVASDIENRGAARLDLRPAVADVDPDVVVAGTCQRNER